MVENGGVGDVLVSRRLHLGVDTGGTFTDAAILDLAIARQKRPQQRALASGKRARPLATKKAKSYVKRASVR